MNGNGNNLEFLDALTILSVILQIMGYQNDMSQSSNDDLMRELQKQNIDYLTKILDNKKLIINKLSRVNISDKTENN